MCQGVEWGLFFHLVIFEVKAGSEKQQGEVELRAVYHTGGAKTGKRSNFHMSNFPDLEMLFGHSFGVFFMQRPIDMVQSWGERCNKLYFARTCTCSCTHNNALCTGQCKCASLIEQLCELSGWIKPWRKKLILPHTLETDSKQHDAKPLQLQVVSYEIILQSFWHCILVLRTFFGQNVLITVS